MQMHQANTIAKDNSMKRYRNHNTNNNKSVRFVEEEPELYWIIDHVLPEEFDLVWHDMADLHAARRADIKNNLRAQYYSPRGEVVSIESDYDDDLTWRGMEDIQHQYNKKEKSRWHVQTVVDKYKATSTTCTSRNLETVRHIAKALSKADRLRALELAKQDALEMIGSGETTTASISSLRKTRFVKRQNRTTTTRTFVKTLSGSLARWQLPLRGNNNRRSSLRDSLRGSTPSASSFMGWTAHAPARQ